MKKILSILLLFSMLLALSTVAHGTAVPAISVGTAAAAPGETVSINIDFLNNPGISSYTLSVSYDKTRLHLDSVVSADGVGGQFTFVKKAVWFSSADVTVSGTFLTLNFTVLENAPDGEAEVSVSYTPGDICNYNEEDVDFTVAPGKITVGDSGGTEGPGTGGGEDEPVTGPAIKVAGVSAASGDTVSVPVDFLNNPGISSYTLSVNYDETCLRLDSVVSADGVGGQFTFVKKAVWFSSADVTVSGTFLTLNFTVLENAPDGEAEVSVSYTPGDICNYNEEDVSFTVIPGSVSIKAADELPGDIDGDGKINAKDMNLMKQAVVGRLSLGGAAFSVADLNGDTKLNAQDCVLLKAIILGK